MSIIWTEKDKLMKETEFCGKFNKDDAACLKLQ